MKMTDEELKKAVMMLLANHLDEDYLARSTLSHFASEMKKKYGWTNADGYLCWPWEVE